ncbi:MAG: endonuclease/exonuclease/phosphatase family protein [Clostridia bacterium]
MTNLKLVTYNMRCPYDTYDGVNAFIHRAGMMLDKIRAEQPHVICFQEVSDAIREFLRTYLVGYDLAGHGRLADYRGEGLCVAWRRDSMELFGLEQFWLSPTPLVPGSRFANQSEYPRICPRVLLRHKDMETPIRIFNVHLDNESDEARFLGIQQILERAEAENRAVPCPTFIMGDFNAQPDSRTIQFLNGYAAFPLVDLTDGLGATYHDFGGTGKTGRHRGWKIDYIFTDPATAQKARRVNKWEDEKNGIYLSDHYPVCCEIQFES